MWIVYLIVTTFLILYWKSLPFSYHLRCMWSVARWYLEGKPTTSVITGSRLNGIVLLDDLDFNFHKNNATYNRDADFGRFELCMRSGLWELVLKNGWKFGIGGVYFQYKREIKPFQRYVLHTRIHSWDSKWLYIEQRFEVNGRDAAVGFVKAVFKNKREDVPPADVLRLLAEVHKEEGAALQDFAKQGPPNCTKDQFSDNVKGIESSLSHRW